MRKYLALLVVAVMAPSLCSASAPIRFKEKTVDPAAKVTAGPSSDAERAPDGSGYYVLQFEGPIIDEWKASAAAAGAEILEYIPDFAFVIRAKQSAEQKLRALPFVTYLGDYSTDYRISKRLSQDKDADVVIRLYQGSDIQKIAARVKSAGGEVYGEAALVTKAHIPAGKLRSIARAAGVASVEPAPKHKLLNQASRGILNTTSVWTNLGLYGSGQIVAVADTGLDTGNLTTIAADFGGRVLKAYGLARKKNDWSDSGQNGGHGTHVTGSILGSGALSGSDAANHNYANSFAGVAPEAQVDFQSVMDNSGALTGIPLDLNNLFLPVYTDGARIHSDSWGDSSNPGGYTTDARNTDTFIWNHKDMTICLAAGNSGEDLNPADGFVDPGSIDSPGTAKNCITVGASESYLLSGGYQGTYGIQSGWGLQTQPIAGDTASNNANGMAGFSSRGPTDDGRIKPDICAPGTNIISCRTHDGFDTLWGVYNSDYVYSGGTSMATPIVAGACALVREYYVEQRNISNPSSALVKATLLNGAFDMTPGQYPVPPGPMEVPVRPNNVEGWGRVDLKNTLVPAAPRYLMAVDSSAGLSTGSSANYLYYAASSTTPLKVTLVWSDYPAATTAAKALVNDLDLTVMGPNGVVYKGNVKGTGGNYDRTNNVESVDVAVPAAGLYRVNVQAYNVPQGPQPYAVVVSGPVTSDQPVAVATVAAAKALADGSVITLAGKSVSAGSDQLKDTFYIEEDDRSSGLCVKYGVGGGPVVHEGDVVTVTGKLATVNGERVIQDPIVGP